MPSRLRRAQLWWIELAVALLASSARAHPVTPAHALLPAAETARATVVIRVDEVTRLDGSGYAATVSVDRVLAGDVQPGASLRIGWEELASARPPRLRAGQRVLVALDDLPQGSLWRQRFANDAGARAIAARGDALLVEPAPGDLGLIAGYLQLGASATPAARAGALAHLAAEATPVVAGAALARLVSLPGVGGALDAAAIQRLMGAAAAASKPLALRREIVGFAGAARFAAATAQLETLALPASALEPEALIALGQIRGGLPSAQVEELLDRPAPALRAVGARFATGGLAERRLPPLARHDPAPAVRAAAAEALAATHTVWGLDATIPVLADSDPQVRSAAAQALGGLGAPAVPRLERVARSQPAAARGAITALVLSGPQGVAVVRQLAEDHPDARLRDYARLALGHGPPAH